MYSNRMRTTCALTVFLDTLPLGGGGGACVVRGGVVVKGVLRAGGVVRGHLL